MGLFNRYIERQVQDALAKRSRSRVVSSFLHPDIEELVGLEKQEWQSRFRGLAGQGALIAGIGGFPQVVPAPGNSEPQTAPAAVTGVTAETNLYTPGTGSGLDFGLIPQPGNFRAPQAWIILAGGLYTSSSTSQTAAFTGRIGTSSTPSSNASLGATGAVSLGNATAVTNGLWTYTGFMQVTATGTGTNGKATCWATVAVSNQAAGAVTASQVALAGNTTASFDSTIQQGFVISVTPSATGVSAQLIQFVMLSLD